MRVERTHCDEIARNEVKPAAKSGSEEWLEAVRRQVDSLRFGVVQIVVHDSRIVQIEKTERIRFDLPST
ncbi:MAG: YezD family protein [Verrucomicrobiota bacterium]